MDSPEIRLETGSGATLLVRLIRPGDRYGPGERLVNQSVGALVDFSQPRGSGLLHVGAYQTEDVRQCCIRRQSFMPGGKLPYRLERDACRRLVEWLDDPYAAEEAFTALLIGDEDRCARVAVMLRQLGLETNATHDPVYGVARASAMLPSLVLLDADGLTRMSAPEIVAHLRRSEARDVPVIVCAAEPAAHAGLPADAVLASPPDRAELAATVAELFELV